MRRSATFLAPAIGLAVCLGLGFATQRPPVEATAKDTDIRFATQDLNPVEPAAAATDRPVAPALSDIQPWISAVGAAVGAADLDGDGTDEACLVDTRDDTVRLFAPPGSPSDFETVELELPGGRPDTVAPMGCVPADLDADGDQDVLVYYWGRGLGLFINAGPGDGTEWQFAELTPRGEVWNTSSLNVADVDGDGHLDILVGNYFPDGAPILDETAEGDARIEMQDSMSLARNAGRNRLLLTTPAGPDEPPTMVDASVAFPEESAESWTLAFGLQDLTGTGLPDIYVANDFGPDQLLVNTSTPGKPAFRNAVDGRDVLTPKSYVLGRDAFKGMGVTFLHLEGSPDASIAVSNITTPYALHESNFLFEPTGPGRDLLDGAVPFTQRAEERGIARGGWSWDIKAADFDLDGREELVQATGFVQGDQNRWAQLQELAMTNDGLLHDPAAWMRLGPDDDLSGHEPNRLWTQTGDGRFQDSGGVAGIGNTDDVSRGFALTDVDGDGLVDVLVANQWGTSRVHLNTTQNPGTGLALNLVQPAGSGTRPAVGAQVTVQAGSQTHYRELFPANGHAGVSGATLHIGLGDHPSEQPVAVSLEWTDAEGRHSATTELRPGAHDLVLHPTGEATQP